MINQREIYLMRYPFSNGERCKVRPALVLSNSRYNNKQDDILACPITSQLKEVEYSVTLETSDLDEGKLKTKCRIRADKIGSVEKELLLHRIGTLKKQVFEDVKTEIFAILTD